MSRISEDGRLLAVTRDNIQYIVTNDGGLVELDAAREYFDVVAMEDVPDDALRVPESMVVAYLPDLPNVNETYFDGRDHFLDKLVVLPRDGLCSLRNTSFNIMQDVRMREVLAAAARTVMDEASVVSHPKAIFPGGMVGGGKGALVVKQASKQLADEGYVLIDRDELRKRFFLYHVATHPEVQAHDFDYHDIHEAISYYNAVRIEYLTDNVLQRGKSSHIIKDGTLSNPHDNMPLFAELSEAGYQTYAHIVLVPIDVGKQRNHRRFMIEGRVVPDEVVDKVGIEVMTHLVEYIASPYVHWLDVVSNAGARGEEVLLAECYFMDDALFTSYLSGDKECIGCVMIKVGEKIQKGKILHKLLIIYDRDALGDAFRDAIEHGGEVPDDVIEASEQSQYLHKSFNAFDLSVLLYRLLKKDE